MRARLAGLTVGLAITLAYVMLLSGGWLAIPRGAGQWFAPGFTGRGASARPIESFPVPQHPFMAGNGRNSMHNDPYATDAYAWAGPLGRDTVLTSAFYGLKECATLAFDSAGRLVGLCGGPLGPQLLRIDPVTLAILGSHRLPGRVWRGVSPLEDLCGGAYFYLDNRDRAVVATTNGEIHVIGGDVSVYPVPVEDTCLIALMPDWAGRVWFVTGGGIVGVLDPATGAVAHVALAGERVANSFAVDETGGVFVVSDHALYRFDFRDGPIVTWRQAYDRGPARKPGQLSHGSGTTPTLTGAGHVAITDNASPRMNVLVYERATGRLVCGEPVFAPGASATDNSLVAVGNALIVENNHGYSVWDDAGSAAGGVARVDVLGDGRCVTAWTNPEVAPSSVAKASLHAGLVYVYAKHGPGWYLSALDIRTGETVFRVLAGVGAAWNNHYAAITLGPDGSAYIATLTGLVRFHDAPAASGAGEGLPGRHGTDQRQTQRGQPDQQPDAPPQAHGI